MSALSRGRFWTAERIRIARRGITYIRLPGAQPDARWMAESGPSFYGLGRTRRAARRSLLHRVWVMRAELRPADPSGMRPYRPATRRAER